MMLLLLGTAPTYLLIGLVIGAGITYWVKEVTDF